MAKKYTLDDLASIQQKFEELIEGRDTHFLIVDERVSQRRIVSLNLSQLGVEKENIHEAGDTMDAMMAAADIKGSVVLITDINMPGMDGLQLIHQFRTHEKRKNDPVIVVSNESKKERIVLAIKLGVAAYLKKPLDTDVLAAKLRELGLV